METIIFGITRFLFYRGNDLTTQFLPDALFFKESILSGKFPIWNPWIFAGMPYLLDPQNLLWYPPNYLFLLLPIEIGFFILLVLHLCLAGYFVKKLLSNLGRWSWIGVALFISSPKLIAYLEEGNWSILIALTWLPCLYWALRERKLKWSVFALSAMIINNINIGYYAAIFSIMYIWFFKNAPLKFLKTVFKIFFPVMICTAPRWLPLLLYGQSTVRAALHEAPLPFWSWMKIAKSITFPLLKGHPQLQNEEILYLGLAGIGLALLGLFFHFKQTIKLHLLARKSTLFWMTWTLFSFAIVLNVKFPLHQLFQLSPGFSLLRITTRVWGFSILAVSLFATASCFAISKKSQLLALSLCTTALVENLLFAGQLFARRVISIDDVPESFYARIVQNGVPVRAYCTTGCIDRLKAQQMGIAILGGNNPIQLTRFVEYLQKTAGYKELSYHPILPPYTVFNLMPQPDAELLGETSTRFVVSPYELIDTRLAFVAQEGKYRLYGNTTAIMPYSDHYFPLAASK